MSAPERRAFGWGLILGAALVLAGLALARGPIAQATDPGYGAGLVALVAVVTVAGAAVGAWLVATGRER